MEFGWEEETYDGVRVSYIMYRYDVTDASHRLNWKDLGDTKAEARIASPLWSFWVST